MGQVSRIKIHKPDADMYWVKFDDDTQPIRPVKGSWLVKTTDV